MKKNLKEVTICVWEPKGKDIAARQVRLRIRDQVLDMAIGLDGGNVEILDAPTDNAIALIRCDDAVMRQLMQIFPDVSIEDNLRHDLPQTAPAPRARKSGHWKL